MPVSISGDGGITGLELGAFEDVSGTPSDNQALTWDAATSQWVPETILDTLNAGIGTNVVLGTTTTATSTTSTSPVDTSLSATITPTSSSSKVLILVQVARIERRNGDDWTYLSVFRGNTASGTQLDARFDLSNRSNTNSLYSGGSLMVVDSPATTSATTYTVGVQVSGAGTIGATQARQNIILIEVAA